MVASPTGLSPQRDTFIWSNTWYREWTYGSSERDTFPPYASVHLEVRAPLYTNPRIPAPIDQFWEQDLLPCLFIGSQTHSQYDWPNPYPISWYRSWEFSNLQFILQQPASFFRNYDFPNPRDYPRLPDYSWVGKTTALTPPTVLNTFRQSDWPNPPPVYWYQSWIEIGNSLLPTKTALNTFRQSDWPNPQPVTWYQSHTSNLLETTLFSVGKPTFQTDWPNPYPVYWNLSWIEQGNSLLPTPTVLNTFRQNDWPNPQPVNWYQNWINVGNVQLPFPTPFVQLDWPNPKTFIPIDQFWEQDLLPCLFLSSIPHNQHDWPLPYPIQWYKDWYQALAPYLPVSVSFSQLDWPNPRTYQPIDQFWFNNLNQLPIFVNVQPFNQTDWPLPRDYQRIDESFWQALALNLPSPPPPIIITSAGKQLTEKDVLRSWMKAIRAVQNK